jgi:hypothetical protein
VFNQNVGATSSFTVFGLASGRYRSWVRAVSANGTGGTWSTFVDFFV